MRRPHIAIIGAGIGGLSAAAVLSRRARVSVYECQPESGGKIRQARFGNRAIDCGPTVFTLKSVFEEIFTAAGRHFEDYVRVAPLDTLARHFWDDGSTLDLFSDLDRSADAISDFAGKRAADDYRAFAAQAARDWTTLYGGFIRHHTPDFVRLSATANPLNLIRLDPYTTYWRSLCRRFSDPRLVQLFGRYATYCGSSPFLAPATLSLVAHVERLGVWTIDGGMQGLSNGLEQAARDNGAAFHFGVGVSQIDMDRAKRSGQGTHFHLHTGEQVHADAVIFNGDAGALARGEIAPSGGQRTDESTAVNAPPPANKTRTNRTQSAITWSFLAKPKGAPNGTSLSSHNVFFSPDYAAEFDDVLIHERPPTDPTVYLFAPDQAEQAVASSAYKNQQIQKDPSPAHGDQSNAPHDGRETAERFFCLINAPANGESHHYTDEEIEVCAKPMWHRLTRCGLSFSIIPDQTDIQTPTTFAQRFPGTDGSLFGTPNHGWRAAFQRPGNRTKVQGLYRAGGGVHPGSGVPMAALSGLTAARALMKDYALT